MAVWARFGASGPGSIRVTLGLGLDEPAGVAWEIVLTPQPAAQSAVPHITTVEKWTLRTSGLLGSSTLLIDRTHASR